MIKQCGAFRLSRIRPTGICAAYLVRPRQKRTVQDRVMCCAIFVALSSNEPITRSYLRTDVFLWMNGWQNQLWYKSLKQEKWDRTFFILMTDMWSLGELLSSNIDVRVSHENYVHGLYRCEELAGEGHQTVLWLSTNYCFALWQNQWIHTVTGQL